MRNGAMIERLKHHAVITEERPASSNERKGDGRLSTSRPSHEYERSSGGIDNARGVNVKAVALPKPENGARARERAPNVWPRGTVSDTASQTSTRDMQLGAVLEIAKQRLVASRAHAFNPVRAPA
jgi:hypothetical protein